MRSESELLKSALVALGRLPGTIAVRRNTGAFRTDGGQFVRCGLAGMADIMVISHGRAIEIEMKSAKYQQSADQKNWQGAVERAGGVYILARSVDDAVSGVMATWQQD